MANNKEFWLKMYGLAQKYSDSHGGTVEGMKVNFRTSDGIDYDPNGERLHAWLKRQLDRRTISDEEIKLLKLIGLSFDKKNHSWEEMYCYAEMYYENLGNLLVPSDFKTNNGFIYNPDGDIKLGSCIKRCRQDSMINTCDDKRVKLDNIGMIWNTSKNLYAIKILCNCLGIDYFKNVDDLQEKSYLDFKVRVAYILFFLKDKYPQIDLVNDKGCLHDIFSMLNKDMKSSYGMNLEELIAMYGHVTDENLIQSYSLLKLKKSQIMQQII